MHKVQTMSPSITTEVNTITPTPSPRANTESNNNNIEHVNVPELDINQTSTDVKDIKFIEGNAKTSNENGANKTPVIDIADVVVVRIPNLIQENVKGPSPSFVNSIDIKIPDNLYILLQ